MSWTDPGNSLLVVVLTSSKLEHCCKIESLVLATKLRPCITPVSYCTSSISSSFRPVEVCFPDSNLINQLTQSNENKCETLSSDVHGDHLTSSFLQFGSGHNGQGSDPHMAHMSRSLSQRILSPDVIMQSMYGRGPLSPEVHGMSVGGIMRRPDSSDQLDEVRRG